MEVTQGGKGKIDGGDEEWEGEDRWGTQDWKKNINRWDEEWEEKIDWGPQDGKREMVNRIE
jgi:hypothetical protein